jgi:hypothetical protein
MMLSTLLLAPSLRPKYLSSHLIFEHPQATILANVEENYSYVYFNF